MLYPHFFLFILHQLFTSAVAQMFDPYYGTYYDPMMSLYSGAGYGFNPYYAYSPLTPPFNTMPSSSAFSSPLGYSPFMPSSATMPIMDFSPPAPPLFGTPSSTPSLLSLLNPFGGFGSALGTPLGGPPTAPPANPFQMNLGNTAAAAGHNTSPFGRQFRTRNGIAYTRGALLGGTDTTEEGIGKPTTLLQAVSQRDGCEGGGGGIFMLKRAECNQNREKT